MGQVVTINPAELDGAGGAVKDRVCAFSAAGSALKGLDLGVCMPPGVAGRVKGDVDGAIALLVKATLCIGELGEEMLVRAGKAKEADQMGRAAGTFIQLVGLHGETFETLSEPGAGPTRASAAMGEWGKRVARGATVVEAMAAGLTSWQKHKDNPYLTGAQKREQIGGETAASTMKMALGMAAAAAAAGSVVPVAGTAVGFLAGLAAGVIVGGGLEWLDQQLGLTKGVVKAVDWTSGKVVDGVKATGEAIKEVDRWLDGAGKDLDGLREGFERKAGQWADQTAKDLEKWGEGALEDVGDALDDVGDTLGDLGDEVVAVPGKIYHAPGRLWDEVTR